MDKSQRKEELQQNIIEAQLKSRKDEAYMRILVVLGIMTIIIATIATISADLRMTAQGATLYVMGIFLFLAGLLWQESDKRKVARIEQELERLRDQEDGSYRYDSAG